MAEAMNRQEIATMSYQKRPRGLEFRAGGNPPINAGMFLDGERIAWWPAGFQLPDQHAASLILIAYEAKGSPLDHGEVRAALGEDDAA